MVFYNRTKRVWLQCQRKEASRDDKLVELRNQGDVWRRSCWLGVRVPCGAFTDLLSSLPVDGNPTMSEWRSSEPSAAPVVPHGKWQQSPAEMNRPSVSG